MLPMKKYVVEAYYHWIVDSGCTPHLMVDTTVDYVEVPEDRVRDNQIVLNLSPLAIRDLVFKPSYLSFRAQFSGITYSIYVPMAAVASIYAKENGEGKFFEFDEEENHPLLEPMPRSHAERSEVSGQDGAPFLRVID